MNSFLAAFFVTLFCAVHVIAAPSEHRDVKGTIDVAPYIQLLECASVGSKQKLYAAGHQAIADKYDQLRSKTIQHLRDCGNYGPEQEAECVKQCSNEFQQTEIAFNLELSAIDELFLAEVLHSMEAACKRTFGEL